jgi:hypothetical protein
MEYYDAWLAMAPGDVVIGNDGREYHKCESNEEMHPLRRDLAFCAEDGSLTHFGNIPGMDNTYGEEIIRTRPLRK